METPKSILKWAGGKAKLINHIISNLPIEWNNYYEPFLGGATVFLHVHSLHNNLHPNKTYYLSDINMSLINLYKTVAQNKEAVIQELEKPTYKYDKELYIKNRERFNVVKKENSTSVEHAALFIYLNKCGYNGLYRENKSGGYNVPFGNMKNPNICDKTCLINFSTQLQNINLLGGDYKTALQNVKSGDFVYLDPPYDETFTDYTQNKFGKNEQLELFEFIESLTSKGVKVMMSNSSTDYIKNLYKNYTQIPLNITYSVGGKNVDRNIKSELLILNYK